MISPPAAPRTLPIRLAILPGESLESWLEALARRNNLTMRQLLPALGLRVPQLPYGLAIDLPAERLRRIEHQTGLPAGRLDQAVLDRFVPLGVVSSPRAGAPEHRWQRWARGAGSRYCPRCLAATDGRWLLSWYLNWSFVCLRHRVLLAEACPRCARLAHAGENRWDQIPAGARCRHTDPGYQGRGPRRPRCDVDLTMQLRVPLDRHHPLLAAQRWINHALRPVPAAPARPQHQATELVSLAGMRVPRFNTVGAVATLMRHILTRGDDLTERAVHRLADGRRPADGVQLPERAAWRPVAAELALAADPALFGVVATLALDALVASSPHDAAEAIAWILPEPDHDPAATSEHRYSQLLGHATSDPVIDAIMLRRRAPVMRIADRLTYRTENPIPRHPLHPGETAAERGWPHRAGRPSAVPARLLPQCAWPSVTDALPSHATKNTIAFRAAVAMAIARTGTRTTWAQVAIQLELPQRMATRITSVWRRLVRAGHAGVVLAGIDALVDALLERPPPIDYARRRWVFRALALVPAGRFQHACHDAGLAATGRRRRYPTMLLWELLTGGDVRLRRGGLRPHSPDDRSSYATFCATDAPAPAMVDYLAEEAERHLLRHRIDEPVTWQPELDTPGGPVPTWRCPAPDRTRRLAGWAVPTQQPALRDSAADHTPRWWSLLEDVIDHARLGRLAFALRSFRPSPLGQIFGNYDNERSLLNAGHESEDVQFVHRMERTLRTRFLAPKLPYHYKLTPAGREFLDSYLWTVIDPLDPDPWQQIAHARPDLGSTHAATPIGRGDATQQRRRSPPFSLGEFLGRIPTSAAEPLA